MVAPFTGAWIEIFNSSIKISILSWSHPSRVRGLKCDPMGDSGPKAQVAPFTGAWIEIKMAMQSARRGWRRTLHGCVD